MAGWQPGKPWWHVSDSVSAAFSFSFCLHVVSAQSTACAPNFGHHAIQHFRNPTLVADGSMEAWKAFVGNLSNILAMPWWQSCKNVKGTACACQDNHKAKTSGAIAAHLQWSQPPPRLQVRLGRGRRITSTSKIFQVRSWQQHCSDPNNHPIFRNFKLSPVPSFTCVALKSVIVCMSYLNPALPLVPSSGTSTWFEVNTWLPKAK